MSSSRAALALSVLSLLGVVIGVAPAGGQTEVEEAEEEAGKAKAQVESAFAIVSSAVADRASLEAELVATLSRYQTASAALAEANRDLAGTAERLTLAEAAAAATHEALEEQVVAAYMAAVAAAPMALSTGTVEAALVADQVLDAGQRDTMARLDELTIRQRELDLLRQEHAAEQARVAELRDLLNSEVGRLEELFARADAAVADAFRRAQAAEEQYRAALDEVEAARAAAEARRREEEAARAATTTTTTEPTVTPPVDPDPLEIGPATERWRPTVAAHFPAELVDDALVIIECESGGDPNAYNPYSGASGLFQFLPGTWAVASVRAGVGDRSVFDGEANVIAAAWLAGYSAANGGDPWSPWHCRMYL